MKYAALEERLRVTQTQLARMHDTLEGINGSAIMRKPTRIIASSVALVLLLFGGPIVVLIVN